MSRQNVGTWHDLIFLSLPLAYCKQSKLNWKRSILSIRIQACASVCLTVKSVLLLNSSRNNSSVDDVQVSKLLRSKVLSTHRSEFSRSTVQLVDKVDS